MKWRFVQDDSGQWYMIPASGIKEFNEAVTKKHELLDTIFRPFKIDCPKDYIFLSPRKVNND